MFRVYVKKVDDRFFHSNERKDRFKSKEFIKKTVTTAFGYVTFERRKYVDKKTGVCYYIDEKIGLKRYRRLSEELIFTILFEYQHTKEKENVSQRRKDQMKMLFNQYEKIRRIYKEKDYIGSRTEALVSHECSSSLSSRPKAFSRKKIKRRAMYHTFFANYGKDRDKAHKVYFNGARADTMEKVMETNCLADIISEAGKGKNIPYLRGGERLIREVLKEISQSRMI